MRATGTIITVKEEKDLLAGEVVFYEDNVIGVAVGASKDGYVNMSIGGTFVSATGTELNIIDGTEPAINRSTSCEYCGTKDDPIVALYDEMVCPCCGVLR